MIYNKRIWMCLSRNVNGAQHNHKKSITNTKIYSGSEHSWLLHPLPKISLGISTIFTLEYSRVVLHRDHNSNPVWFFNGDPQTNLVFHGLTKNPGGFTRRPTNQLGFSWANQEPWWFYTETHQPTWFSRANQKPWWFFSDIHQPIQEKINLKAT